MNREEKEAIEYFEQLVGIDKKYEYSPIIIKTTDNTKREFEILLNLIDKLQKENEQKQETIDRILKDLEDFYKKYDVISKDKIKEEILNFIPQSIHEVEFKTKLLKIIGETKDEE